MSLIQEALEKAGRRLVIMETIPFPVEGKRDPYFQEAPVEKIPVPKADPFWLVGLKIKMLGMMDKLRIVPARKGEPRSTGFIVASLIGLFLAVVIYIHTMAGLKPLDESKAETAPTKASAPRQAARRAGPPFELTGVTSSGNTPLALINNQVVGVGDRLKENAKVVEIRSRKVVLDFRGKRIELEL